MEEMKVEKCSEEIMWDTEKESALADSMAKSDKVQRIREMMKEMTKEEREKVLRECIEDSSISREESQSLLDEDSDSDADSENLLDNTTILGEETQLIVEPRPSGSGTMPQQKNGRCFDPKLGDNEFSDEDSPSPSSPKKRKSKATANVPLTPLNKSGPVNTRFRQRKVAKNLAFEEFPTPSQSPISSARKSSSADSSADPNYEPSNASTCTESSFEDIERRKAKKHQKKCIKSKNKSSKKIAPPGPRTSSPIPVIHLEDEEHEIPDFDEDDKENNENEGTLRILSPRTINSRIFEADPCNDQEEHQGTEAPEANHDTQEDDAAVDEITVLPDIHHEAGNEETETNNNVKQEKPRKIRPGKAMLLQKLREVLGICADDEHALSEEDILASFSFKGTIFSSEGFAQDHCPCQLMKEYHEYFEIMADVAANNGEKRKLDICPKCFLIFTNCGNENRRDFLQMVHQMHCQGLHVTYVRTESQNRRIFEVLGTKKWLKSLKQQRDLKEHPYLAKSTKFFKLKSSKVFMELLPAGKSKCGSKLRKTMRNAGEKHRIFVKIQVTNGEAAFSIRDLESVSQCQQSTELQTSILDYYTKEK